jgi:hypothetical protein
LGKRLFTYRFAVEMGWLRGDGRAVLKRWLSRPPTSADITLGLEVLATLAREPHDLAASISVETLRTVLSACHKVATTPDHPLKSKVSISPEVDAALQRVADGLTIAPGESW